MMGPGLYNMDCMEGMREFPDGFFDLAVVDPPYGISIAAHHHGKVVGGGGRPFGGKSRVRSCSYKSWTSKFYHTFADDRAPDEGYFTELARVSKRRIIWGGNFMLDNLGAASCMIVWDKKRRGMDQADCEIAWTDLPGQSRIFEYRWNGMLQENMREKETRLHPTQKPVALYSWILRMFARPGMKILDTHAGSAPSVIACRRAGLDCWAFELDKVYFEMASRRIAQENAQLSVFDVPPEQLGMC